MEQTVNQIMAGVARFVRWWQGELLASVPPQLQRQRRQPLDATLCDDGTIQCKAVQADRPAEVCLTLGPDQLLQHVLLLPDAGHRTMAQMVELQLERLLPVPIHKVYTHWHPCVPSKDSPDLNGQRRVCVYAAKRKDLDRAAREVSKMGAHLIAVRSPEGECLSGLLPSQAMKSQDRRTLRRWGRGLLVALLISLIPVAWQANLQRQVRTVQHEIEVVQNSAVGLIEVQNLIRDERTRQQYLETQRAQDQFLDVLVLLSEHSPDSVSVREMTYDTDRVSLSGIAASAADWAISLEQLEKIGSVDIKRVSGTRSASNSESFNIEFGLSTEAGGG